MRFITAVAEKDKGSDHMVEKVSRELWNRIWSRDQDICEAASLSEVFVYKLSEPVYVNPCVPPGVAVDVLFY